MSYEIAAGWDNEAGLVEIAKQPRLVTMTPGRRQTAGDGLIYEDGFMTAALEYGFLTPAEYDALLTAFGLSSAASAKVTIALPQNEDRTFAHYNAIIIRPEAPRFERGLWLDVSFPLTRIEMI